MKLTPFGKMVRLHRLHRDCSLTEMSDAAGVSPSFASAVETGAKRIPPGYADRVATALRLNEVESAELRNAADLSVSEVKIALGRTASRSDREVATMFARRFAGLPAEAKINIRQLLEVADDE